MKRLTTLNDNSSIPFDVSKGIELNSSFIEFTDKNPNIKIGYGVKLNSAQITVLSGGELVIGDLSEIRGRIIVGQGCKIIIGCGLICNDDVFIQTAERGSISIGDDCLFARCRIYNSDMHGMFDVNTGERLNKSKDVIINNKVWLARDSMVLKGTQIGSGCVVGAGSIVNGSFDEFSVLAGNPAKKIRTGVTWSRNMTDTLPALLPHNFPISKYRSLAMQFKHSEVIEIAISLWCKRDKATESDYYVMYYFSRAILLKHFRTPNTNTVKIGDVNITIKDVCDNLLNCFELSGMKNGPCGSYARLAAKYIGDTDRANHLYNIVKPFFPSIDAPQYN
ncbi:acyltransferase [Aeromonas hydrophila]|uniref:acyltransferase n=1 Tax=Aeromonas hydrophila TaxID=644 RepID=UPI003D1BB8B7